MWLFINGLCCLEFLQLGANFASQTQASELSDYFIMPPSRQLWYYSTGNFRRPKLHELWTSYGCKPQPKATAVCVPVLQHRKHLITYKRECLAFSLFISARCFHAVPSDCCPENIRYLATTKGLKELNWGNNWQSGYGLTRGEEFFREQTYGRAKKEGKNQILNVNIEQWILIRTAINWHHIVGSQINIWPPRHNMFKCEQRCASTVGWDIPVVILTYPFLTE